MVKVIMGIALRKVKVLSETVRKQEVKPEPVEVPKRSPDRVSVVRPVNETVIAWSQVRILATVELDLSTSDEHERKL